MSGKFYGVSVGPGDPELMTIQAARVIREVDVIAAPAGEGESVALEIARRAVPELSGKPLMELCLPMTRDEQTLEANRAAAAEQIAERLLAGDSVAMLTLGDVSIYSTALYLYERLVQKGFSCELVAGVPSFCAAAARLGTGLVRAGQPLHILPGSYGAVEEGLGWPGVKVLMKTGKSFPQTRTILEQRGLLPYARMIERCGMEGERVFHDLAQADDSVSYFSMILVEETK